MLEKQNVKVLDKVVASILPTIQKRCITAANAAHTADTANAIGIFHCHGRSTMRTLSTDSNMPLIESTAASTSPIIKIFFVIIVFF